MLTGIKIRIQTDKFEETVHFYSEILGLKVFREWANESDTGSILGLPDADGNGYLEIAAVPESQTSSRTCLQFRTDDLNNSISKLKGRIDHSPPEKKPWGSSYIYLKNPAGNQVIVFEGEICMQSFAPGRDKPCLRWLFLNDLWWICQTGDIGISTPWRASPGAELWRASRRCGYPARIERDLPDDRD